MKIIAEISNAENTSTSSVVILNAQDMEFFGAIMCIINCSMLVSGKLKPGSLAR